MLKKLCSVSTAILLSAALGACSETAKTASDTTVQTTMETTVQTTSVTTAQTTAETTAPLPQKELTEEQKQIQALLTEAKQFYFDYYRGYEIQTHIEYGSGKYFTQEVTKDDGETFERMFFEVVSGDVTTKDDLINEMKPIFTDELTDETLTDLSGGNDYYYFDDEGKIYITSSVGGEGGQLGYDEAHICSVDEIGDDTLVLNMTAFGSAERWGYDNDAVKDFTVTLKRTEDGLRISRYDHTALMFITYQYKPEYDIFDNDNAEDKAATTIQTTYPLIENVTLPDIHNDIYQEQDKIRQNCIEAAVLDTEQVGDLTVELLGRYVMKDTAADPEAIFAYYLDIRLCDGNTEYDSQPAFANSVNTGQGAYRIKADDIDNYLQLYKMGEHPLIVFNYYDADGGSETTFYTVTEDELFFFHEPVEGLENTSSISVGMSEDISVNEALSTITDYGSGIEYTFDFDTFKISAKYLD